MNTRNVVIAVIFLLLGSFATMELKAQDAIKALMKKCESMENVTIDVIRNRNSETGKVIRLLTTIRFEISSNPGLEKEFLAAFQKDAVKASQEIESMSGGKMKNVFYRFGESSYSYTSDNEYFSFNAIEKFNE